MTLRLWSSVSVLLLMGRNTPFAMSVRSSASIAGLAVAGSSLSALLAVMWNTLVSDKRLGGFRSLIGYLGTAMGAGGAKGRSSVGTSWLS